MRVRSSIYPVRKPEVNRPSFHKDGGLFYWEKMNERRLTIPQHRFDKAQLTDQGFLEGIVPISRIGVFPYRNDDGSFRFELRHPKDVFDKKSLDSFRGLPINVEHEELMDSPEAIARSKVGQIGDTVYADGELVQANVKVDHPRGLGAIKAGAVELSSAYSLDLLEESGVYEGQTYTHRQTNIRGDHLTLTKKARLGRKLRLDSADPFDVECDSSNLPKERPMKQFNIDGIAYDAAPEVINFIGKLTKRATDAEEGKEAAEKDLDKEKAESAKAMDGLKGQLTAAKADQKKAEDSLAALEKDIPARAAALAKDKADLMVVAQAVLPAGELTKVAAMDSADIRSAVIKAKYPDVKLDGQSADFANGLFESVKASVKATGSKAFQENRATSADSSAQDGAGDQVVNADAAREKMLKRQQEAYLKPKLV